MRDQKRRCHFDWEVIQHYHDSGRNRDECMSRFGFGIASWYKANRTGRLRARGSRFLVDWKTVQQYYDLGHTFGECRLKFGFSPASWSSAVKRGALTTRLHRFSLERILAESSSRSSIKRRLLDAGLLYNRCDECGVREWLGKPLSIQLHHRNGKKDDHRLENLAMLCPNCHSQTSTFGIRNRKKRPLGVEAHDHSRVV